MLLFVFIYQLKQTIFVKRSLSGLLRALKVASVQFIQTLLRNNRPYSNQLQAPASNFRIRGGSAFLALIRPRYTPDKF
jgi:hypothetical protein